MASIQKTVLLGTVLALSVLLPSFSVRAEEAAAEKAVTPAVPYIAPMSKPDTGPRPLTHGGKQDPNKKDPKQGYIPRKAPDKNPYEGKRVVNLDKQETKKPTRTFSVK